MSGPADGTLPAIPPGMLVRPRLIERIDASRVTVITALPGFGKTVVARQWADGVATPTAWISVDVLGSEPKVFWTHVLGAVRRAQPLVDDEPAQLLAERGPEDPLFLEALAAQLDRGDRAITIVLDGLTEHSDGLVVNGLGHLVERAGEGLGLVVTSRARPALRIARWKSAGWLTELREADLRLTDDEAVAMAAGIRADATPERVVALNRRLDGWPIGLHMALLADRPDAGSLAEEEPYHLAAVDRTLAEYLVDGVLSGMPETDRELALRLSVLRWFDAELCHELGGDDAPGVVNRLLASGTFLSVIEPRTGVMQFHSLFRELMELHLSVTDPMQRVALHRLAADHLEARGEIARAYEHLVAIGESGRAREILVEPALALVAEGELEALRSEAHRIPATREVDRADLALDVAAIAFFAEGTMSAAHWCDHAEAIIDVSAGSSERERTELQLRLLARRGAIALMDADLETAFVQIERYRQLVGDVDLTDSFDAQFPILAARVMLALRREADSAFWIERARRITGPEVVTQVTVPTLRAWHEWLFGDLPTSVALSDAALAWMEEHAATPNHLTFDTLITAGWGRVGIGDLEAATRLSRAAIEHADALGYAWQRLQAGYLAAQVALLTQHTGDALRIIDDLRAAIPFEGCRTYSDRIVAIELEARAAAPEEVSEAAGGAFTARFQLLRASRAEAGRRHELLADRDHWLLPDRVRAELLLATGEPGDPATSRLEELVATCAEQGWVLPFLGLPDAAVARLRSLPLEELHPRLARCLAATPAAAAEPAPAATEVELTPREASLLPLLPTHLSYAEIGEQLFLSVNTVKSNLQRLYRKLGAHTRHQAVASARRRNLL